MWNQEMIKQMFPNNRLPSDPSQTADSLLYSNYDTVAIREQKMARNMVIQSREIEWHKDGRVIRNILYDVYPFPAVNEMPALSVYGGKMVQNWLQLKEYHQENKENKDNAGFNYTGL